MSETLYRGRQARMLDNGTLQIVVMLEGGHIAAVIDKATGVNPLWSPPWPSMDPSRYDPLKHPEYGGNSESRVLAGLLGHNLCLDLFGAPSESEAAAGMTVHGEASINPYEIVVAGDTLTQSTILKEAQMRFDRIITLPRGAREATIHETVENLATSDRPIAWTQHVTLGPPFLENGRTEFRVTATRSKTLESDFTNGKCAMKIGTEFLWPMVPCTDGSEEDLRIYTKRPVSGAFSTHLMDPQSDQAGFVAWSPSSRLAFGYSWTRSDFPWMGLWEENRSRATGPWNGITVTRGLEFGVSPFPESRRSMIDRGELFGVPTYRWLPAREKLSVSYRLYLKPAAAVPEL
jgi:hypothetical protein